MADFVFLYQLVDRILQTQKARRQATEKAEREEIREAEREAETVRFDTNALLILNLQELTLFDTQANIPITQTNIQLPPAGTLIAAQPPKRSRLTPAIHELGHLLRQNLSNAVSSRPASPSPEGAFVSAQPGPSSELVRPPQPDLTVTSLSNIGMSLETGNS